MDVEIVYLQIEPFSLDGDKVMDEMERMLNNLTGGEAVVTGFVKGTGPKGNKVIPPTSLETSTGKDHCCDKGQWVDRDPPHGPPKGEFGIAFVSVSIKNVDQDKVDHAIAKLNGKGFANSKITITKISELPDSNSYNLTMR